MVLPKAHLALQMAGKGNSWLTGWKLLTQRQGKKKLTPNVVLEPPEWFHHSNPSRLPRQHVEAQGSVSTGAQPWLTVLKKL